MDLLITSSPLLHALSTLCSNHVIEAQRLRDTHVTFVGENQRVREILIAGLGSVGRRHLANLRALGWTHIRIFRTGSSPLPHQETQVPIDHDLHSALSRQPLAVIVANPTACHLPLALEAAKANAHLLIEKPLSHTLEGVDDLERLVATRRLIALLGFQFRFNPGLQQLRTWIRAGAIGRVVSAQVHWGEYLPDMHPWEDYRKGYAARAELGGGVLLTLCHPFDYLRWLVGEFDDEVCGIASQTDTLGLSVDTCVDVMLRFRCGASAHVHLDFVQRPLEHRISIVGTEGTVTWNQADHAARLYSVVSGRWITVAPPQGFERDWMFLEEMRHFLACLRGDTPPACTIRDGRAALEVALACKRAIAEPRLRSRTA
jgi:predicted dehydrogenase